MLRLVLAICYRALYRLHHAICLRPGEPLRHSRLVVVGAYRTGGAGKTPFSTWLAETLSAHEKHVAILCHEYAYDEAAMLREAQRIVSEVYGYAAEYTRRNTHGNGIRTFGARFLAFLLGAAASSAVIGSVALFLTFA